LAFRAHIEREVGEGRTDHATSRGNARPHTPPPRRQMPVDDFALDLKAMRTTQPAAGLWRRRRVIEGRTAGEVWRCHEAAFL